MDAALNANQITASTADSGRFSFGTHERSESRPSRSGKHTIRATRSVVAFDAPRRPDEEWKHTAGMGRWACPGQARPPRSYNMATRGRALYERSLLMRRLPEEQHVDDAGSQSAHSYSAATWLMRMRSVLRAWLWTRLVGGRRCLTELSRVERHSQ